MAKSRRSKRLEKKTRKNFLLTVAGILIVFFVLFKFGIPMLANFSLFISQIGKSEESEVSKQKTYIAPPVLNPLPSATNSAKIIISGKSFKDQTVSLYINDELVDKETTDDKGDFVFNEILDKGKNEIRAKVKQDENVSDFSRAIIIIFEDEAPELTIDTPSDGQSFKKGDQSILVSGKTNPNADVTINGFWAVVSDDGTYTYTLNLSEGENTVTIIAINEAGNEIEKSVTVSYSP